jgi:DNA-binding transcriptional ArsR family regulator
VILNETGPIRDVYDAVADPTRRKLLRLLADKEKSPRLNAAPLREVEDCFTGNSEVKEWCF